MIRSFDEILDECVDRINRGERLEDCLASHPEQAEEIEPLLRAMLDLRTAYAFTPSAEAKRAARQRFNAARGQLERKREERQPLLPRILGWPAWAAVTTVLLVALIGYFGLRPALLPVGPSPQPSTGGNFAFLISDEVNAIGDFQSLDITISKIGLHLEGGEWIELTPEIEEVDLTQLQGKRAQVIWSGNITEGRYTKAFIYVENARGVLLDGNETDVKVPSHEKLHISKPFMVAGNSTTSFVYDVTVVSAGNEQSGIKYHLKPQIAESGADQEFEDVTPGRKSPKSDEHPSGKDTGNKGPKKDSDGAAPGLSGVDDPPGQGEAGAGQEDNGQGGKPDAAQGKGRALGREEKESPPP